VGLEDDIWYDPARTKLARNSELIRRIHNIAEADERKIMPPAELRRLLNLEDGHGRYGRIYKNNSVSWGYINFETDTKDTRYENVIIEMYAGSEVSAE